MLSSETNHHHFTTAAVEISTEEPLNGAGKDRDFQVTRGMGLAAGPATAEARGANSSIILLFSFSKPLSFLPKHCKRDLEATNLLDGALEVTDLFIDLSGVPARVCCHNWNQHGLEDDNLVGLLPE
ncbi:hypothetical protein GYH30_035056 [Glycine max]|nr:hypothetical protein GYH30_035056 [Glycine max]